MDYNKPFVNIDNIGQLKGNQSTLDGIVKYSNQFLLYDNFENLYTKGSTSFAYFRIKKNVIETHDS